MSVSQELTATAKAPTTRTEAWLACEAAMAESQAARLRTRAWNVKFQRAVSARQMHLFVVRARPNNGSVFLEEIYGGALVEVNLFKPYALQCQLWQKYAVQDPTLAVNQQALLDMPRAERLDGLAAWRFIMESNPEDSWVPGTYRYLMRNFVRRTIDDVEYLLPTADTEPSEKWLASKVIELAKTCIGRCKLENRYFGTR